MSAKKGNPVANIPGVGDDGMCPRHEPRYGEKVSGKVRFAGYRRGSMKDLRIFGDGKNVQRETPRPKLLEKSVPDLCLISLNPHSEVLVFFHDSSCSVNIGANR